MTTLHAADARASAAPVSLADEFRLDGDGDTGRYRRDISPFWTFGDNRVFGGYSAALVLAAAARALEMPGLLSCHVMFVEATRSGPVECLVEPMRCGRGTAAVRAVMQQAGEPTVIAQAWLTADALPGAAPDEIQHSVPGPEGCREIAFRAQTIPFMAVFEERAVDYPDSPAAFHSGPAHIDVWVRPRLDPGGPDRLISQLFDVLALDAHLLDPTLRARKSLQNGTASLDLGVTWCEALDPPAWRRVRTQSGPAVGRFVATSGVIRDAQGNIHARATQQGRVHTIARTESKQR